jgi:DNA-binding IclR family transcriptional regulator
MSTLQTLDRGLTALTLIAEHPAGISIAELAEALDVHRAICYRIVATLREHGLVSRDSDGRVRLGAATAALAARFEPQLRRAADPVLHTLARQTGATAHLSVAQGEDCIAVLVAEPPDAAIRVGYRVGSRHPLTVGAAGLAILALRPAGDDEPAEVATARRLGYAITVGQLQDGAVGVAAGIPTPPDLTTDACVGVVAVGSLDTTTATQAVTHAAHHIATLTTPHPANH